MAQFIAFDPKVEVLGSAVLGFKDSLPTPESRKRIVEFFTSSGIIGEINPKTWYKQQGVLNVWKLVSDLLGPASMFLLGKTIPEKAVFPPEIDSLEKGLHSLDVAYKMNHRGGEIGYYRVTSFDIGKRTATMECKNPYPSDCDRGIIAGILRKFKPRDSIKYDVVLDYTKPTRLKGADSCSYNITW